MKRGALLARDDFKLVYLASDSDYRSTSISVWDARVGHIARVRDIQCREMSATLSFYEGRWFAALDFLKTEENRGEIRLRILDFAKDGENWDGEPSDGIYEEAAGGDEDEDTLMHMHMQNIKLHHKPES